MAKQKSASSVFAKLKARGGAKSHSAHKGDETQVPGGGDLPAGIEMGVARLTKIQFGLYKSGDLKDEPYFMAMSTVIAPETFNGLPIKGMMTSVGPEPLCDTPNRNDRKTFDEHYAHVLNWLRLLGMDTNELEFDDLEAACETLVEEGPYHRFRTWASKVVTVEQNKAGVWVVMRGNKELGKYKSKALAEKAHPYIGREPRTNHDWGKNLPDYIGDDDDGVEASGEAAEEEAAEDDEPTGGVASWDKDDLAEIRSLIGPADDEGDEDAQTKISEAAESVGIDANDYDTWEEVVDAIEAHYAEENSEEGESEEESAGEDDLVALGENADEGDEASIDRLNELAGEAGLDPDGYDTWAELAEALAPSEEEGGEEDAEWQPEKEEIYGYKPPTAKKPIECEVVVVDKKSKTVDLKNLADDKLFKKVPWDKLESA